MFTTSLKTTRLQSLMALLALSSSLGANAKAQEMTSAADASKPTLSTEGPPLWEIGGSGFAVSRPAYPGSDTYISRALVVPFFLYRGEHLRLERGNTGYRAVKTPRFEFDIGFAGALGSSSDKVTARRGMDKLGHMIEFGPRLNWYLTDPEQNGRWRFELPWRAVFELNDGLQRRGYAVEPELQFDRRASGGWRYTAGVSAVWGSKPLADTFYRVRADQVLPDRSAYDAKSGLLVWTLFTSVMKPIDKDWRLYANFRVDSVVGAANEKSSLVRRKTAPSLLLGVTYTWKQSERRAGE